MDDIISQDKPMHTPDDARLFADEVRHRHRESNHSRGLPKIPPRQQRIIEECVTALPETQAKHATMTALLQGFEKMCLLHKVQVPDHLHAAILNLLITEFRDNLNAFKLKKKPSKLIPVTVYCGAIGPELCKAFPELAEELETLVDWMKRRPVDPIGSLQRARETILRLSTEPRFEEFKDLPGYLLKAAKSNDPEGWLRQVQIAAAELYDKIEFIPLRNRPNLFHHAVVYHLKDADDFLRRELLRRASNTGQPPKDRNR